MAQQIVSSPTGFTLAPGQPDVAGLLGDLLAQNFNALASGAGSILNPAVTKSGNYAVQPGDSVILTNGASNQAISLPSTGIPVGKTFTVKNIGSGSPINVEGPGTEMAGNWQLYSVPSGAAVGGSVTLVWDGSSYWALSYSQ